MEMMIKNLFYKPLIALIASALLFGCNINYSQKELPLFKAKCIQDTLLSYLSHIDSLPDPYGNPTIVYILLYEADNQTMIDIDVETGWLIWPQKDSRKMELFCKGRVNDRLVFILGNPKLKCYVNTKQLLLNPDDEELLKRQSPYMLMERINKSEYHREYHYISPDSLVLVKSGIR